MSVDAGDPTRTTPRGEGGDVMAAVDRGEDVPTYVIADVSVDDAWLAVPTAEALSLPAWR